jgi:MFS family permease
VSAIGMVLLTGINLHSTYALHILPGLVVVGFGMGLVFASAMSLATGGVDAEDAGVASALVNTGQQVGGSIGTALLNTLAATAMASYLADHAGGPAAQTIALAQVHSYVTAFWWSAAIFSVGALICGALLGSRVPEHNQHAEPVLAS